MLSLVRPAAGYLVLLQRVGASPSLLLPTIAAPTFFNLIALGVEVAGICCLLSARMASAIPSLAVRIALAVLVVVVPNAYDRDRHEWRRLLELAKQQGGPPTADSAELRQRP